MDLKNLTDDAGDVAKDLTGKAKDALDGAANKIASAVPNNVKDKAVNAATDLIGKAADKLEGK